MRLLISLSAVFGFLAVALGAFGAHGLKKMVDAHALEVWHTGVFYQFVHALALLAIPVLASFYISSTLAQWAGWCFVLGILLFSGSLYAIVLLNVKNLGIITPIGGVFFLIGWALLFIASLK